MVEQIQTRHRLSTSDVNQQTVHKTMKVVGEFVLSALRETPCFTEKTADYGIRQSWVCTLTCYYSVALGKIFEMSDLQCPCVGN